MLAVMRAFPVDWNPELRGAGGGIIGMRRGAAQLRWAPFLRVNEPEETIGAMHGRVARPKPIGIVYGPGTLLQLVQMVPPVRPLLRHHPPSAQQPVQLFQNSISLTSTGTTKSQLQPSTGRAALPLQPLYSLGRDIWSLFVNAYQF
jgi:hypothetical protein